MSGRATRALVGEGWSCLHPAELGPTLCCTEERHQGCLASGVWEQRVGVEAPEDDSAYGGRCRKVAISVAERM